MDRANRGHAPGYGEDDWTAAAVAALQTLFGVPCDVFFVFNGTAANALALAHLCRPYHAAICAHPAHVITDECGAPGFFGQGLTLLSAPGIDGKLTPGMIERLAISRTDVHAPKAHAVTISQTTETGQVYTPAEVAAIGQTCRALGLRLHMDGARFANACAALGCHPAELANAAGVDVLSFGGTKNGMAASEALVFFDHALAQDFEYRRKQAGQLASKMRFLAAPWVGVLAHGAWLRHAAHANACAYQFATAVRGVAEAPILYPPQANAVFLRLSEHAAAALRARGWVFYTFAGGQSRFMFAWDTDPAMVTALALDVVDVIRPPA